MVREFTIFETGDLVTRIHMDRYYLKPVDDISELKLVLGLKL